MKIEESIQKNCLLFNKNQRQAIENIAFETGQDEKAVKYGVKRFFDYKFSEFVKIRENIDNLIHDFDRLGCKKSKIPELASDLVLRKLEVKKLIFDEKLKAFERKICNEKLLMNVMTFLEEASSGNDLEKNNFSYLKTNLEQCIESYLPFILRGGNKQNFNLLESGNLSSSQGDGAEHIFVAKAMIAGFNASVVDLGASGYDAVIENQENKLLRVQIKSFTGDNISRKGRDRGGEGIDSSNESNKGKLVTSKNCDLFVAVNKQNSELFIFSNAEIDSLPETQFKRKEFMGNWENWSKINE